MQHDEPWRNPELTLADVVSMLYTNRTSLAQAIREAGYAGFKEYVGYYRIREFKRLVGLGRSWLSVDRVPEPVEHPEDVLPDHPDHLIIRRCGKTDRCHRICHQLSMETCISK